MNPDVTLLAWATLDTRVDASACHAAPRCVVIVVLPRIIDSSEHHRVSLNRRRTMRSSCVPSCVVGDCFGATARPTSKWPPWWRLWCTVGSGGGGGGGGRSCQLLGSSLCTTPGEHTRAIRVDLTCTFTAVFGYNFDIKYLCRPR